MNTGSLPFSYVQVVLRGHVQLSASKLNSSFLYRVGIKDSRVEKKNGYLYLPFSAFNLPRGAILNFMTSWLAAFCDRQILDNGNQLRT